MALSLTGRQAAHLVPKARAAFMLVIGLLRSSRPVRMIRQTHASLTAWSVVRHFQPNAVLAKNTF